MATLTDLAADIYKGSQAKVGRERVGFIRPLPLMGLKHGCRQRRRCALTFHPIC